MVLACQKAYFDSRLELVLELTRRSLSTKLELALSALPKGASKDDEIGAVVQACVNALAGRLISERAVFSSLFLAPGGIEAPAAASHLRAAADGAFSTYAHEIAQLLAETLRPVVLQASSMLGGGASAGGHSSSGSGSGSLSDNIASLVSAITHLKDRVGGDLVDQSSLQPLQLVSDVFLRDLQERLIFLATEYIASELIEGYTPALSSPVSHTVHYSASFSDGSPCLVTSLRVFSDVDYPATQLAFYLRVKSAPSTSVPVQSSWFPVVERTLSLLSLLFPCLPPPAFGSLAQDAVSACQSILLRTSTAIRLGQGGAPSDAAAGNRDDAYVRARATLAEENPAASLNRGLLASCLSAQGHRTLFSHLFLIRHLLLLREQLAPFFSPGAARADAWSDAKTASSHLPPSASVNFASVTKTLDFAPTSQAISHLFSASGAAGLLSFSSSNTLFHLLTSALPNVEEKQTDVKRDLEALIKRICEECIAHVPLLLFAGLAASPETAYVLQDQAPVVSNPNDFSNKIASALENVSPTFSSELTAIKRAMGLCLASVVTCTIIFNPIKERIYKILVNIRNSIDPVNPNASKINQLLDAFSSQLETSEQLVLDPANDTFGY
jgi:hypothetical protein